LHGQRGHAGHAAHTGVVSLASGTRAGGREETEAARNLTGEARRLLAGLGRAGGGLGGPGRGRHPLRLSSNSTQWRPPHRCPRPWRRGELRRSWRATEGTVRTRRGWVSQENKEEGTGASGMSVAWLAILAVTMPAWPAPASSGQRYVLACSGWVLGGVGKRCEGEE
jgi:hypothetical protein